jgi:hypothetical protein
MSDRVALLETLSRIEGNVGIAKWFLTNEDDDVEGCARTARPGEPDRGEARGTPRPARL